MPGLKPDPTTIVSTRIPNPILTEVDDRAQKDLRNRSQMIYILLRYALDNMPHPKR